MRLQSFASYCRLLRSTNTHRGLLTGGEVCYLRFDTLHFQRYNSPHLICGQSIFYERNQPDSRPARQHHSCGTREVQARSVQGPSGVFGVCHGDRDVYRSIQIESSPVFLAVRLPGLMTVAGKPAGWSVCAARRRHKSRKVIMPSCMCTPAHTHLLPSEGAQRELIPRRQGRFQSFGMGADVLR